MDNPEIFFSASVDVDRILREMDVKTLQDNIMHVTFSNIEAELVSVFSCRKFIMQPNLNFFRTLENMESV